MKSTVVGIDTSFYEANKLSFFPLPYKEKKDETLKWGVYQKRLPTDGEIRHCFKSKQQNIAVVCGKVSGGLVVLDCDSVDRFYELAAVITEKLDIGDIAIVALQKKRGAELGRGGDFGLEKPRLYLTMDKGKLTIQKAKNWTNSEENPNGLIVNFKIVAGCKFIITQDWHQEE